MADNTALNIGAGGDIIATDDIAGVKYQRVKLVIGIDGANDGDIASTNPIPTKEIRPATASLSNVAASASSVLLLTSNSNRKAASVFNDSTVALYINFGGTASVSAFTVKVGSQGFYEIPYPCYTGTINGIWDSATGAARITEVS